MNHYKFHNFLFAILLLISCANATNATGTDDWKNKSHLIQETFDNAIRQFVGQFATESESTSDANDQQQQQQLTHLTYKDAAHILKGIEEIVANQVIDVEVANKLIAAGEKKHDIEMG
jgi:hypothetical protein